MNRNRLYERVREALTRATTDPAPESFYEGVWRRIRNQQQQAESISNYSKTRVPFAVVCWRSVPVFGVFLLAASLYLWFSPPETETQVLSTVESYVLDSGEMPTNGDLLYNILFPSNDAGLEKNP
ncbi:MAG: hypothetical protein JW793_06550 [Acidobacteria bacterium]|nr:hypothetical protein [Acidobacteriota bacterium]